MSVHKPPGGCQSVCDGKLPLIGFIRECVGSGVSNPFGGVLLDGVLVGER